MEENRKKEQLEDLQSVTLAEYYNFNLQKLAEIIKIQNYKPKPKMLYL